MLSAKRRRHAPGDAARRSDVSGSGRIRSGREAIRAGERALEARVTLVIQNAKFKMQTTSMDAAVFCLLTFAFCDVTSSVHFQHRVDRRRGRTLCFFGSPPRSLADLHQTTPLRRAELGNHRVEPRLPL